jgi:hypothetical protein
MEEEQRVVGGNQGSFAFLYVRLFVLLSCTNQCPFERVFYCNSNPNSLNLPNVINFLPLPLLIPQAHWMSLGCIGTGPCDTMAPSTVMWMPIYRRLGTGRLGTIILSILFVD